MGRNIYEFIYPLSKMLGKIPRLLLTIAADFELNKH